MAITKIKHKGLREIFESGQSRRVEKALHRNAVLILDHLDGMADVKDCTGVKDFHPLKGDRKGQYSMHVSGNWCIVFTFDGNDVTVLGLADCRTWRLFMGLAVKTVFFGVWRLRNA